MVQNSENIYTVAQAKLDAYIAANGLRCTQERYCLLQYICSLGGMFEADKVIVYAREQHISPATVYNALNLFVSAQILHSLSKAYGRGKTCYELMLFPTPHIEVVCTRCGRVSELKDKAIENIVRMRRYTNFVPHGFSLYIYGECKTCKRRPLTGKN